MKIESQRAFKKLGNTQVVVERLAGTQDGLCLFYLGKVGQEHAYLAKCARGRVLGFGAMSVGTVQNQRREKRRVIIQRAT